MKTSVIEFKKIGVLFLILILSACHNAYNADEIGRYYCDCMQCNDAVRNFDRASTTCDAELVKESGFYKLWAVDMRDRELDKKISEKERDSVKVFITAFTKYINSHCCTETLTCPDSTGPVAK